MCSCRWFGGHQILILKDQAAIVSEPLRSIKQMASYWDLKWLKQVEPNDPVDLNNSTADVCFAHFVFFSRAGPTVGRISLYFRIAGQPCTRTSRLDVLSEVLHASFDMSFFAGMPKDCYVKLFSPPSYVWCYGHTKENIFLQSIWSNAFGQSITWSQTIDAVCEFTSWFYSQNLWICFQHAPCNLQDL